MSVPSNAGSTSSYNMISSYNLTDLKRYSCFWIVYSGTEEVAWGGLVEAASYLATWLPQRLYWYTTYHLYLADFHTSHLLVPWCCSEVSPMQYMDGVVVVLVQVQSNGRAVHGQHKNSSSRNENVAGDDLIATVQLVV